MENKLIFNFEGELIFVDPKYMKYSNVLNNISHLCKEDVQLNEDDILKFKNDFVFSNFMNDDVNKYYKYLYDYILPEELCFKLTRNKQLDIDKIIQIIPQNEEEKLILKCLVFKIYPNINKLINIDEEEYNTLSQEEKQIFKIINYNELITLPDIYIHLVKNKHYKFSLEVFNIIMDFCKTEFEIDATRFDLQYFKNTKILKADDLIDRDIEFLKKYFVNITDSSKNFYENLDLNIIPKNNLSEEEIQEGINLAIEQNKGITYKTFDDKYNRKLGINIIKSRKIFNEHLSDLVGEGANHLGITILYEILRKLQSMFVIKNSNPFQVAALFKIKDELTDKEKTEIFRAAGLVPKNITSD